MNYLVATPSRTGSSFILQMIRRHSIRDSWNVSKTHEHTYISKNPEKFICILSKRHDNFASMCSQFVFFMDTPAEIDIKDFLNMAHWNFNWFDNFCSDGYKKVVTLYFEDFINDPDVILQKLNIERATNPNPDYNEGSIKSHKKHTDYILNYQELKDVFNIIKETGSYDGFHIINNS